MTPLPFLIEKLDSCNAATFVVVIDNAKSHSVSQTETPYNHHHVPSLCRFHIQDLKPSWSSNHRTNVSRGTRSRWAERMPVQNKQVESLPSGALPLVQCLGLESSCVQRELPKVPSSGFLRRPVQHPSLRKLMQQSRRPVRQSSHRKLMQKPPSQQKLLQKIRQPSF